MPRTYTEQDGLTVCDLLQYGLDHLSAAEHLFQTDASFYDSAGYLAHLGIEILLKAWLLHSQNKFIGEHRLSKLWKNIQALHPSAKLTCQATKTMELLDEFEQLRYPDRNKGIGIGFDDWPKIVTLERELWMKMPDNLLAIQKTLTPTQKGGRILLYKSKQ